MVMTGSASQSEYILRMGICMGTAIATSYYGRMAWEGTAVSDFSQYDSPGSITTETLDVVRSESGWQLTLNWPIKVDIYCDGGLVIVSNNDLNVYGYGETKAEALEDFKESFQHFWKYYRDINDDKILGYAKRLKSLFLSIVQE